MTQKLAIGSENNEGARRMIVRPSTRSINRYVCFSSPSLSLFPGTSTFLEVRMGVSIQMLCLDGGGLRHWMGHPP